MGDIYKPLAANITHKCSSSSTLTWSAGSPPSAAKMVTVFGVDRTEYHVCGNLTLSGSGSLTGTYPSGDTIIVVENGSLTLAPDPDISANRTAIVLTGNNGAASAIEFPNGAGHGAGLNPVSPYQQRRSLGRHRDLPGTGPDQRRRRRELGAMRNAQSRRGGLPAKRRRHAARRHEQQQLRLPEDRDRHLHDQRRREPQP